MQLIRPIYLYALFSTIFVTVCAYLFLSGQITFQSQKQPTTLKTGYLTNQNLLPTKEISKLIVSTPTSTNTPVTDKENLTTKTYTNTKYSFQFDYPKDWILNKASPSSSREAFAPYVLAETDNTPLCGEGSCVFMYLDVIPNTTINKQKAQFVSDSAVNFTDLGIVTIGEKRLGYFTSGFINSEQPSYLYEMNGNVLSFVLVNKNCSLNTFAQIIKSLK